MKEQAGIYPFIYDSCTTQVAAALAYEAIATGRNWELNYAKYMMDNSGQWKTTNGSRTSPNGRFFTEGTAGYSSQWDEPWYDDYNLSYGMIPDVYLFGKFTNNRTYTNFGYDLLRFSASKNINTNLSTFGHYQFYNYQTQQTTLTDVVYNTIYIW